MIKNTVLSIFLMFCVVCGPTETLSVSAAEDNIVIANFGDFYEAKKKADSGANLSVATSVTYNNSNASLKWNFTDIASYVETMQTPQRNLSEYDNFRMRFYSENANDQFVVVATYNSKTGVDNNPYFYCIVTTKGIGWEEITLSQSEFVKGSARPTEPGGIYVKPSWSEIGGIYLQTTGWGSTTVKGHCIYIDKIWLEKSEKYGVGSISSIYSKEVVKAAQKALDGGGAVYAGSPNVVTNGGVYKFNAGDSSVTAIACDGTLMVPVSFFEDYIGCAVTEDDNVFSITYNNIKFTAEVGNIEYTVNNCSKVFTCVPILEKDIVYVPAEETAKALGLYTVTKKNFEAISSKDSVSLLECEYGVNEYSEVIEYIAAYKEIDDSVLTAGECKKVKDNWRYELVGSLEDNRVSDAYIGRKLNSIAYHGKLAWDTMQKGSDTSLFSDVTVTATSHMTLMYNKLYNMTLAYGTYGSAYYKNAELGSDIKYGLEWMYSHLYGEAELRGTGWRSTDEFNWWDWDIGSPGYLVPMLIIMEEELSQADINKYLKLFDYLVPEPLDYGSNAILTCELAIGSALLKNDGKKVVELQQKIDSTFLYSDNGRNSGEGFYTDGSYVFHQKHSMNGAYGLDHLKAAGLYLNKFDGTAFEITNPNVNNVLQWTSDALIPFMYQGRIFRMVKGRYPTGQHASGKEALGAVLSVLDRYPENEQQLIKSYIKSIVKTTGKSEEEYIIALSIYNVIQLSKILNDNSISSSYNYVGNYAYNSEDKVVHHRDNFALGVSMSSSRIFNYESINGCNLTGWYVSDGMTEYYTDGEYTQASDDYWNNVNPYRLPGTTVDSQQRDKVSINNNEAYLSNQDFVGGVSIDGLYGVAAMNLESYHKEKASGVTNVGYGGAAPVHNCNLEAKKSYFMFDDEVVCLGADINASNNSEVVTVVDNKLSKSNSGNTGTDIFKLNGSTITLTNTNKNLNNAKWAHYENVGGYYFPNGGNLYARQTPQANSFMELWFSHGTNPSNEKYAYVLLPSMTAQETKSYSDNPDIEILSNTAGIQAVRENNLNVTGYVFRKATSFDNISVDAPMLVMIHKEGKKIKLSVQDPTHKLSGATIKLGENTLTESCDSKMSISSGNGTLIEIDFEQSKGRIFEAVLEENNELTAKTVTLYDFDGNVTVNNDSNISRVKTILQNNSNIDKDVYLLFAQYDKSGKLLKCNMAEKLIKSGEISSLAINSIIINDYSVRNEVFIWDKKTLAPVKIINRSF